DHVARNICLSIYRGWIELRIEHLPQLGQRCVELRLLRGRNSRIRHYPVGNEMPLEQSLGEPDRLRAGKKQLLRLLNLLLPLCFRFSHFTENNRLRTASAEV